MSGNRRIEYVTSPSGFARSQLFYALIGGIDRMSPTFAFERDNYDAFEMIYITSGKGWFRCGKEWIFLQSGDGLIYSMKQPHAFRSDPDDPYEMMYVVCSGTDLDKLWHSWFNAPYLVLPEMKEHEPFVSTLRSVLEWMAIDRTENEPIVSALLYQLFMHALLRVRASRVKQSTTKPALLERGRLYLEEHSAGAATIQEAAGAAGVSYYHFIRQFKRHYGYTPKEYLTKIRIGHAKHYLLHTDRSITEIGELTGFGSYNAFLASFLQQEGCSPSYFRKTWRRQPSD